LRIVQGLGESLLSAGEAINLTVQRAILGRDALAPEFAQADLPPVFKPDRRAVFGA